MKLFNKKWPSSPLTIFDFFAVKFKIIVIIRYYCSLWYYQTHFDFTFFYVLMTNMMTNETKPSLTRNLLTVPKVLIWKKRGLDLDSTNKPNLTKT